MTTPIYDILVQLYASGGRDERALQDDIVYHLQNGYVFATPECFIMGRQLANGWFVHAAVGVGYLETFFNFIPYDLEYIGWEKHDMPVRWHKTETLKRKINYGKISPKSATDTSSSST